jgi:hypothetical protein
MYQDVIPLAYVLISVKGASYWYTLEHHWVTTEIQLAIFTRDLTLHSSTFLTDILITKDFAPRRSNPIAVINQEARLLFDLKLQNADVTNIAAVPRRQNNFAVDFYFSQADLSKTSISGTKVYKLKNAVEPGLEFALIGNGPASKLITFTTTGTLPNRQCNKYVWFCACVREGTDAKYSDSDTSNNCQCRPASDLISCSPGKSYFSLLNIRAGLFKRTGLNWRR